MIPIDSIIVLTIVAVSALLFVTEKLRVDVSCAS